MMGRRILYLASERGVYYRKFERERERERERKK
jgi:hypothetical protein